MLLQNVSYINQWYFYFQKKFRRVKQISDEEDSDDGEGNSASLNEAHQRDVIAREIFQEDMEEEEEEPVSSLYGSKSCKEHPMFQALERIGIPFVAWPERDIPRLVFLSLLSLFVSMKQRVRFTPYEAFISKKLIHPHFWGLQYIVWKMTHVVTDWSCSMNCCWLPLSCL